MAREPIWEIAANLGVKVVTDPDWHWTEGAYYSDRYDGVILLPAVIPMRVERWYVAHELGHHCNPVYRDPVWLAEAKADRWAVKTLWRLYDADEVAWPGRPVVQNLLAQLRAESLQLGEEDAA